jgi:membrane protease YdiL (CAAX protease family)
MKYSAHWGFSLQEFAALYLITLALWAVFYLLAGEQLRSWTDMESRPSLTSSALFMLKFSLMWGLLLAGGMTLSKRVDVQPTSLTLSGPNVAVANQLAKVIGNGILWGLAITIAFDLSSRLLYNNYLDEWNATARFQNWRSFLAAAVGAALGEEGIFRLFLFPLVAWIVGLIWKTPDGLPTVGAMWISLVAVSIIFASTHLVVVKDFGGYTPANIMRGMLVFTPPAVLLCLSFWKHGIETAMIAHASGLIFGWLVLSTLAAFKTA